MNLYYVDDLSSVPMDKLKDTLRLNILYMIQQAGSGHIGGSLSSLDIMFELFYKVMKPEDIFITSKGHDAPALYAILQHKGILSIESIHTLRRSNGLPGHPTVDVPGVLFNTGSLGMGISKANGLAIADRLNGIKREIYVLVGDGELQEGQNDEAIRNIQQNVRVYVDCNEWQLSKRCYANRIYKSTSFPDEKLHPNIKFIPTLKGSGVSFLENNNFYHAGALSQDEYELATHEIISRLDGVIIRYIPKISRLRSTKPHQLIREYKTAIDKIDNERVLILDADLANDCGLQDFKENYPERFIEFGISEQDMVSTATGLSEGGYIPIVHSFAAFLCRRANEQIYNACLENRHIIFVGVMAGILPVGPGTSHECRYDIELMKTMPNITILQPKAGDVEMALNWAINEARNPVYISLNCWEIERIRRQ